MDHNAYLILVLSFLVACSPGDLDDPDPNASTGVDAAPAEGSPDAPAGDDDGTPDSEVCGNGLDDDGDGEIDEDCACTVGEERSCYDGDPALAGIGVCTLGVQVCETVSGGDDELESAEWGACVGSGQPSATGEQCDGVDDDCDDEVDEDCPTGLSTCSIQCAGAEHVQYNASYGVWIKVVLCSPDRYDLFMGESQTGPFYKIGDTAGHGQDHCELVNPTFTMPSEDDINSGTCSNCIANGAGSITGIPELFETPMYFRPNFGEPFEFTPSADHWGIHVSCFYECGVSF